MNQNVVDRSVQQRFKCSDWQLSGRLERGTRGCDDEPDEGCSLAETILGVTGMVVEQSSCCLFDGDQIG